MKPLIIPLAILVVAGCSQPMSSNSPDTPREQKTTAVESNQTRRDNTEVNKRDRSTDAKTPIDQNENQKDIDITASIRKKVVDSDMSTNAKNAKIMTADGRVTLRGPVASDDEKKKIDEIAVGVAGTGNVDNQLEVQP